jgi:hypothetical protein
MKAELEQKIREHWNDLDFDKIRLAFKDYLIGNGDFSDDYLNRIAELLGISTESSYDGYDRWWELDGLNYIQYIDL